MVSQVKSAFIICYLLLAAVSPAAAQAPVPTGDEWHVVVAPYFLGAAMNGTAAVLGQDATIDMSFSDILDHLQFGAMGLAVARKGNWGVGGDAIWMALGANGTGPGTLVTATADFNQGAFAFYGIRRLGAAADLFVGARVNTLQATLRFDGPAAVRSVDGSQTWLDPIVGVQLRTPENGQRWHGQVYAEMGGFGAGSTFTWQIFPAIGVAVSKRTALEFGYRWLDIDYSTGETLTLFRYDVLTQGPLMGVRFKF